MSVATLNKLRKFLHAVREIDGEMTVQRLQVLVEIMAQPGIDQQTLIKKTDQTRSAVSKNIADYSAITSRKKPGPDLIESRIDPMNRVIRQLYPTEKGKRVWAELMETL